MSPHGRIAVRCALRGLKQVRAHFPALEGGSNRLANNGRPSGERGQRRFRQPGLQAVAPRRFETVVPKRALQRHGPQRLARPLPSGSAPTRSGVRRIRRDLHSEVVDAAARQERDRAGRSLEPLRLAAPVRYGAGQVGKHVLHPFVPNPLDVVFVERDGAHDRAHGASAEGRARLLFDPLVVAKLVAGVALRVDRDDLSGHGVSESARFHVALELAHHSATRARAAVVGGHRARRAGFVQTGVPDDGAPAGGRRLPGVRRLQQRLPRQSATRRAPGCAHRRVAHRAQRLQNGAPGVAHVLYSNLAVDPLVVVDAKLASAQVPLQLVNQSPGLSATRVG